MEEQESQMLKFLLKADFPRLLNELTKFWAQKTSTQRTEQNQQQESPEDLNARLNQRIVKETMGALGIFCASIRWGDEPRMIRAIDKMKSIGNLLLHSYDPYSWLLAKLCAEVAVVYDNTSKRYNLLSLSKTLSKTGQTALERYLRQCYYSSKALTWPSQVKGIEKLIEGKSFALCTPTGSGKTTIAELAILQSLFSESSDGDNDSLLTSPAPLVIYLVPSKALAAEVESALTRVLRNLNDRPINVTGLYGGTDWGPTDTWFTSTEQTVLICTPEKAEALIRFLGPQFLKRVSLLVVDEAHSVQFDSKRKNASKALQQAENRPLRLEALCSRLFTYLDDKKERIVALSAVAKGIEKPLTRWVTGQQNAEPTETIYRSTRQLIGRLEYLPDRRFTIKYDLLDGANLKYLEGRRIEQPFIPDPIPQLPFSEDYGTGPEIQLRPYLFWTAIHLAAQGEGDLQHSVLVSVTQHINTYAKEFLKLLEKTWANISLPIFFQSPQDKDRALLWEKCLLTCEDYFGKDSHEYRLLQRGVVVHHGKMPGLLARLLTDAIQDHIVYLVIATSTLSEGVNLPFETILIPNLLRGNDPISEREFGNLAGRAGRPGYGTEGRTLVLYDGSLSASTRRYRVAYDNLVKTLQAQEQTSQNTTRAKSPLAELLDRLEVMYRSNLGAGKPENFHEWLEQTEPLKVSQNLDEENGLHAIETLDTLDSLLLSCIVEVEQLAKEEISADSMEERLREIWQRSYAHYASHEEQHLQEIFLTRGRALKERIYTNARWRKKMYHTSLPPRHGNQLIERFPFFKQNLEKGREYARWDQDKKLRFIQDLVADLTALPKYKLNKEQINKVSWRSILQWWLIPTTVTYKTPEDVSSWYDYVSSNFGYRFNWGFGSIVALAADEALGEGYLEPSLENWPLLELPWIALWLKELIIWGTLEPVAAYLLSKNMEVTRARAEGAAEIYYEEYSSQEVTDELLNPYTIRDWATRRYNSDHTSLPYKAPESIPVKLTQDFSKLDPQRWRVFPVQVNTSLNWFDPSGTLLATCQVPSIWSGSYLDNYDFKLNPNASNVSAESYLAFRQ
jgi:DEAD/DEAH box helicase